MNFGNFFPFHYFCFSSNKKGAGTPPSPVLSISIPLIPENFRPIPICFFVSHFKWLVTAVDNAIEKNKCAVALSDAVIKLENNFFTVSYIAEGNLVIDRSLPGCGSK